MSGRVNGSGHGGALIVDESSLDHKEYISSKNKGKGAVTSGGRDPDNFSLHGCGQTDSSFKGRQVTSRSSSTNSYSYANALINGASATQIGLGYHPVIDSAWNSSVHHQHQQQLNQQKEAGLKKCSETREIFSTSSSSSSSSAIGSGNGRSKKTTEEKTKATWKDLCSFIAFMVSLVTSPLPTLAGVGIAGLYSYYWKGKEVESKDSWGSTTVLVAQTVAMIMGLLGPKAFPNLPKLRFPIQIAGTFVATQVIMQEILFGKKKPEGGDSEEESVFVHVNKAPAWSNPSSGANSSGSARYSSRVLDGSDDHVVSASSDEETDGSGKAGQISRNSAHRRFSGKRYLKNPKARRDGHTVASTESSSRSWASAGDSLLNADPRDVGPASTFRRDGVEADTFRRLSIEEYDDE